MNSLAALLRSYWPITHRALVRDKQKLQNLLLLPGTSLQLCFLTIIPLITHTMRDGPWMAQQALACLP